MLSEEGTRAFAKAHAMTSHHCITVLGATGYTGRFVAFELLKRGVIPVLAGRNIEKLARLAQQTGAPYCRIDFADPASLDQAIAGASAVINCAGPFLDTAVPAIDAALRNKTPYLDVTAEQITALTIFHRYHDVALRRGITILPAMAFYGGLGDLMATAVMGSWLDADRITVAIALDSWHPTEGTRRTSARNNGPRYVLKNGCLELHDPASPYSFWNFCGPFGRQEMVAVPLSEVVTISRHLATRNITTLINRTPLEDLKNPDTPPPEASDASGRSAQRFTMEVQAERGGEIRQVRLSGRDIYAVSAELVAEAASRLCEAPRSGVLTAGMAFEAKDFLTALCRQPNGAMIGTVRVEPAVISPTAPANRRPLAESYGGRRTEQRSCLR